MSAGAIVVNREHARRAALWLWGSDDLEADPVCRVLRRHVLAGLWAYVSGRPRAHEMD